MNKIGGDALIVLKNCEMPPSRITDAVSTACKMKDHLGPFKGVRHDIELFQIAFADLNLVLNGSEVSKTPLEKASATNNLGICGNQSFHQERADQAGSTSHHNLPS